MTSGVTTGGRSGCGLRKRDALDPVDLPAGNRHAKPLFDLEHEAPILGRHERVGLALTIGAASSPDAMGVSIGRVGHVEVDDVGHLLDVDTSGRDVSRHENVEPTAAKALHRTLPLPLGHIAL
jgi:hypothetical protein